jgi:hypothetical protein
LAIDDRDPVVSRGPDVAEPVFQQLVDAQVRQTLMQAEAAKVPAAVGVALL